MKSASAQSQAQPLPQKRLVTHSSKPSQQSNQNYGSGPQTASNGTYRGADHQPQVLQKSLRHKQVRSNHGSNNSSLHRQTVSQGKNYSSVNVNPKVTGGQSISAQHAQQIQQMQAAITTLQNQNQEIKLRQQQQLSNSSVSPRPKALSLRQPHQQNGSLGSDMHGAGAASDHPVSNLHFQLQQANIQQQQHMRSTNKSSFLLNAANSKTKKIGTNFSVSPNSTSISKPMTIQQQNMGGQGTHPVHLHMNKSPVAVSNPSTFTISTNQNIFNSSSPNSIQIQQVGQVRQIISSSNGSSTKQDQSRQTLGSDMLLATDSSIKQRENIKHFVFKPSNLKLPQQNANSKQATFVHSSKISQKSLNVQHNDNRENQPSSTIATQNATSNPTPRTLLQQSASQIKKVLIHSNQNSHHAGSGQQSLRHSKRNSSGISDQKANGRRQTSNSNGKQVVVTVSNGTHGRQQPTYGSPDATLSNDSKRGLIVVQPNLVKKPLESNAMKIIEAKKTNYSSQKPSNGGVAINLISSNKLQDRPKKSINTSKTKPNSKNNSIMQPARYSIDSIPCGDTKPNSSNHHAKHKKRGNSENVHTESNNRLGLLSQNSSSHLNQQAAIPSQYNKAGHKQVHRGQSLQNTHNTSSSLLIQNQQSSTQLKPQAHAYQDKVDHKEMIVNHIRKYIKGKKISSDVLKTVPSQTINEKNAAIQGSEQTEEIIDNLRDFLTYLEGKNIINQQKLQDKDEMKNLLKDIMKLDLTKFSQQRQKGNVQNNLPRKKRKVHASPNPPESRTVPTQHQNFATNPSKHSIKLTRSNRKSTDASPSNYRTSPKYAQNYGLAPHHQVIANNDRGSHSHSKAKQNFTQSTNSSVNFILPSQKSQKNHNSSQEDISARGNSSSGKSKPVAQNLPVKDVYGFITTSQNTQEGQPAQNSPSEGSNYGQNVKQPVHGSKYSVSSQHERQNPSAAMENKQHVTPAHSPLAQPQNAAQRPHSNRPRDSHSQEPNQTGSAQAMPLQLRKLFSKGPATAAQSPVGLGQKPAHSKQQSKEQFTNQGANTSQVQSQPQPVPTIQLMINTNGQGKYLGINVNNYCIQQPQQQHPQQVPVAMQQPHYNQMQPSAPFQNIQISDQHQPHHKHLPSRESSNPRQQKEYQSRVTTRKPSVESLHQKSRESPDQQAAFIQSRHQAHAETPVVSKANKVRMPSSSSKSGGRTATVPGVVGQSIGIPVAKLLDLGPSNVELSKTPNAADIENAQRHGLIASQERPLSRDVWQRALAASTAASRQTSNERQNAPQQQSGVKDQHGAPQQRSGQSVPQVLTREQYAPETEQKSVVLNDAISDDRDKLIRYIKAHVKKHGTIPHTSLEFYKFVKLLGKGAFGKITLGIHKLTGKYVAIKSIDKANIKDEYSRRKVFQEVYILKKIRHSCVIRLLEVFESEKHFLMVMEYSGGGDLLQYVKKRKRLNEQSSKAIFKQILYALGHCHCRSVLHRDIKLDNVLMDGEGGVKLCDFGVSRMVKKGHTIQEQCGTPAYLAPEIIIDKGYQGFSADIWSLGVLLYAMVQGTVPFKASNITDLHKLILAGEFDFPVDSVSAEVKDLVRRMLVLDPAKRISIPQMLNHPWVADVEKGFGDSEDGEDEEHDLKVGSTFFRQEVLGGLITGHTSGGNENGNINFVNVENLYYRGGAPAENQATNPEEKVTYSDYCALTEDFMTYRIDEDAMEIVTGFGFPRNLVIDSINRGDVNHATAAYYLLVY